MRPLSAVLVLAAAIVQEPRVDGERPLCDGATLAGRWGATLETLEGWSGLTEERRAAQREAGVDTLSDAWKVEQGELAGASSRVLLTTLEELGDFELHMRSSPSGKRARGAKATASSRSPAPSSWRATPTCRALSSPGRTLLLRARP